MNTINVQRTVKNETYIDLHTYIENEDQYIELFSLLFGCLEYSEQK